MRIDRLSTTCRSAGIIRVATVIVAVGVLWPVPGHARIDPSTWEELLLEADLVGIVECVTAGGAVARFKVVDSWKGPPAGTELNLRMPRDHAWESFEIALCGERLFVTAFRSPRIRTFSQIDIPLSLREIPTDYSLPLSQGSVSIPIEELKALGQTHRDEESLKRAVRVFLDAPPSQREARLLVGLARKRVFQEDPRWNREQDDLSPYLVAERKALEDLREAERVFERLVGMAARDDALEAKVRNVLVDAGSITADLIANLEDHRSPWTEEERRSMCAEIRWRSMAEEVRKSVSAARRRKGPSAGDAPLTQDSLERMCRLFEEECAAKGPADPEGVVNALEVLEILAHHDPGPVVRYLLRWKPSRGYEGWQPEGYVLGSTFCRMCGKDRKQSFVDLLGAKDPYLRVSGAVYLCMEDRELGLAKLEELMRLDGGPGLWAAIVLASRGRPSAVDRALVLLDEPIDSETPQFLYRDMRLRLFVLLSNSAKASHVSLPKGSTHFEAWWPEHGRELRLHDPWLEILDAQKVD